MHLEVGIVELIPLRILLESGGRSNNPFVYFHSLALEATTVELIPLCTLLESGGRSDDACLFSLPYFGSGAAVVELISLCTLLESGRCSYNPLFIFARLLWKRRSLSGSIYAHFLKVVDALALKATVVELIPSCTLSRSVHKGINSMTTLCLFSLACFGSDSH
ncbi:hypothetical protein V6N11_051489 [Hibiscus sabdariffa]|uniref:Uncharacterized protein n=1 Tax=Hibiscus sabdariffa TaxID=183260 RepID=A0ABR2U7B7_9ROSI